MFDSRAADIRRLNALSTDEVVQRAGEHLVVVENLDELHHHFAESIATTVEANNAAGRLSALILPYGPVGQYPVLRDRIQRDAVSLEHCRLFFMDDYADEAGTAFDATHPLSFKGAVETWLETIDPALRPRRENVIFPNESNAGELAAMIEGTGGIEVCYGGIGIHGHIAFNEPEAGVRDSGPRLVQLNEFTRTINAIREGVGGDLEHFPRQAWTLGMRQCLGARGVELYCRNTHGLGWSNTVLRLALLGEPGDDYPVTWIREHPNYRIVTDRNTLSSPEILL
jgi:glucosamine-6-phosphate deaminase